MKALTKKLLCATVVSSLTLSLYTPIFAEVTHYIVEDVRGDTYQYDFQQLKDSYRNKLLGISGSELYEDYNNHNEKLKALLDTQNGYVDYDNVKQAYRDALLTGETFILGDYTQSDEVVKADMPSTVKNITFKDGQIKVEDEVIDETNLPTYNFDTAPSLEMGKTFVMVELNTDTPEDYEVYVSSVKLGYNASAHKFIGDVLSSDAVKNKVIIKSIKDNRDVLKIINIY